MKARLSFRTRMLMNLAGLSALSLILYGIGAVTNSSLEFSYLSFNLLLAWLPLLVALLLVRVLRDHRWSEGISFGVTLVWLLLLPNSFYMISDFIHISDVPRHNLLYDVVMFTAFIFTATILGFTSLYIVHRQLRRRLQARSSTGLIGIILLLCSFAIYLGRDLRWNSWDVLLNPAGILFDVSEHLFHPMQNLDMFTTTATFFVLLSGFYVVAWQLGTARRS